MKRFAFALGIIAAATFAAPLAAQGPWYDPANTGSRSGGTRNGTIYNDGRVDSRRADGVWRAETRDRNGNTIYVRTRRDSNGNLIQERATRNVLGQYRVIDRRVVSSTSNRRNSSGIYRDRNGVLRDRNGNVIRDRRDRDDDRYDGRYDRRDNDRWDENNGHDNGKHKGWYKNKGKHNKNKH